MPSLSSDANTVLEINHHLVHLNTGHTHQRFSNADFLGNIIHHQTIHISSSNYNDSQHHHFGGHSTNDPVLPGHNHGGSSADETEEESLIVVYALFVPLLLALFFILVVALYVRRMRRASCSNSSSNQKPNQMEGQYQLEQYDNPAMEFTSLDSSVQTKLQSRQQMTTFSYPPRSRMMPIDHTIITTTTTHSTIELSLAEKEQQQGTSISSFHSEENKLPQKKNLSGKIVNIMNIPKRIKEHSTEKHRFNIYTIPIETREQLKQIYVY